MMRTLSYMLFLVITCLRLGAQVSINAQLASGGLVPLDQLWNVTLTNNSGNALHVYMKVSLRDAVSNVELLSGKCRGFLLEPGIKPLFMQDVQPILYNFTRQDFSNNFLPLGAYITCYELVTNELKETPLTQECIQLNIDPLSPPLLNFPADKSEIQNPYPQFSWIPPTPSAMFTRINYDLVIAEVLPGQAPADAIQVNIPIYTRTNLSQPFEYISSATGLLQAKKQYAWQVLARNASNYAGKTEVWTFSLKDQVGPSNHHQGEHYFTLGDAGNGIHYATGQYLKVRYYSTAAAYTALINFFDSKGKKVKSLRQILQPGNNYLDLKLNNSFTQGQVYKLCLVDQVAGEHYLSFKMQ